jgi:Flp pilus assembly protein TadG
MLVRGLRILKAFRRFGRARRGSAALEFAIVAFPFFLLTIGLAEISMIGFAQSSLDYAVSEASRQIRTGRAQMGGVTEAQINTQLCTELNRFVILGCNGNLFLDVDTFASFVDAESGNAAPIQNNTFTPSPGYNPGLPSSIVVVRAFYRWQIMTPLFEPIFQNVSGGQRILVSTMMFRNEPYQSAPAGGNT